VGDTEHIARTAAMKRIRFRRNTSGEIRRVSGLVV